MLPPKGTYGTLKDLVDKCYAMGQFPALWAVEGIGNYYAETFRERGLPLKNILTDSALDDLPPGSWTMLHAGIGLSFSKRCLEGLTASSPTADLRKALEKFIPSLPFLQRMMIRYFLFIVRFTNSADRYFGLREFAGRSKTVIPVVIGHKLSRVIVLDNELVIQYPGDADTPR